jgi:hypothetical protein
MPIKENIVTYFSSIYLSRINQHLLFVYFRQFSSMVCYQVWIHMLKLLLVIKNKCYCSWSSILRSSLPSPSSWKPLPAESRSPFDLWNVGVKYTCRELNGDKSHLVPCNSGWALTILCHTWSKWAPREMIKTLGLKPGKRHWEIQSGKKCG